MTKTINTVARQEFAGECLGVPGRFHNVIMDYDNPGMIRNQKFETGRKPCGNGEQLRVTIRFDDECKNGHESFSITGDIFDSRGRDAGGGCCHDLIAATFPELAPLIKWHLCSTDGPLHYLSNVTYFAGDRDHYGLRKGEIRQIRNGKTGKLCWKASKSTLENRYVDADECPTDTDVIKFEPLNRVGEGKERDLDAARRGAIWPEATDNQLCDDKLILELMLKQRLPGLMAEFKQAMLDCGFIYPERETL